MPSNYCVCVCVRSRLYAHRFTPVISSDVIGPDKTTRCVTFRISGIPTSTTPIVIVMRRNIVINCDKCALRGAERRRRRQVQMKGEKLLLSAGVGSWSGRLGGRSLASQTQTDFCSSGSRSRCNHNGGRDALTNYWQTLFVVFRRRLATCGCIAISIVFFPSPNTPQV